MYSRVYMCKHTHIKNAYNAHLWHTQRTFMQTIRSHPIQYHNDYSNIRYQTNLKSPEKSINRRKNKKQNTKFKLFADLFKKYLLFYRSTKNNAYIYTNPTARVRYDPRSIFKFHVYIHIFIYICVSVCVCMCVCV